MDEGTRIEVVLEWAEHKPFFDTTFIESLKEYYESHGELTMTQSEALDRIIEEWNIKEE
jgi:hypothetical protein